MTVDRIDKLKVFKFFSFSLRSLSTFRVFLTFDSFSLVPGLASLRTHEKGFDKFKVRCVIRRRFPPLSHVARPRRRRLGAKLKWGRKEKLSSGHRRCRTAASHGAVLVDGVAGRVRRVRGLPGTGAPEPANEAYAHQFQAPSTANHEELLRDKSESGRQGSQAARAEDRLVEKGATGTGFSVCVKCL